MVFHHQAFDIQHKDATDICPLTIGVTYQDLLQ